MLFEKHLSLIDTSTAHCHFNWLIDTSTASLTLLQREPGFVTNGSAAGCFLKTSFTHWHFNCSLTLQLTHWHFNWLIDTSGTVATPGMAPAYQKPILCACLLRFAQAKSKKKTRAWNLSDKNWLSISSVSPLRNSRNHSKWGPRSTQ